MAQRSFSIVCTKSPPSDPMDWSTWHLKHFYMQQATWSCYDSISWTDRVEANAVLELIRKQYPEGKFQLAEHHVYDMPWVGNDYLDVHNPEDTYK